MTHPLGDIRHHFWMVQSMAKVAGADLSHAMHEGRLTQRDWADAVTRCRGCEWAGSCARWVRAQGDAQSPAPGECANAGFFARLAG